MAFVSAARIARAIESLKQFHAFFGVTFLSMKIEKLPVGSEQPWGSPQENKILNDYYSPAGAPPERPFYLPFKTNERDFSFWKARDYSGSSIQRARKDGIFAPALLHSNKKVWGFKPDYVATLAKLLPTEKGGSVKKVPVFDLAAWMFRELDLPDDMAEVEQKFRATFKLTDDTEYNALFDNSAEDSSGFFFEDPISESEIIELTGGVYPGPELGARTEDDLVRFLDDHVRENGQLSLPDGYVRTFYYALKSQHFAVLSGRPGTGKSAFARAFADALKDFFQGCVTRIEVTIGQDFTEADVIGYEKIAGNLAPTELTQSLFLDDRPNDMFIVILDEMNLSQVDHYFSRILPAIESGNNVVLPGESSARRLPSDTFVVGTINSWLEEQSRIALSGPVKRRANVIEMPNYLEDMVRRSDRAAFNEMIATLLQQSRKNIAQRRERSASSVLDNFRDNDLVRSLEMTSSLRSGPLLDAVWTMCEITMTHPTTSLTSGVLQDVLEHLAMAGDNVMDALDRQIAHKIVPQISGPATVAKKMREFVSSLGASDNSFHASKRALDLLLSTEDSASGTVTFIY